MRRVKDGDCCNYQGDLSGKIRGMPLLVDGHNLIGHMPDLSLADSDDEAQLVFWLRKYAMRKRGRQVVVIFDHGVYGHPQQLNGYGVECHFSTSPRDADADLIRRIRAIQRKNDWQVITSDHAVADVARACGIRVLSAQEFARRLHLLDQPVIASDHKPGEQTLSPQEVEEWLRLFGVNPNDNEA